MPTNKFFKVIKNAVFGIIFLFAILFVYQAHAATLTPGNISTCGTLASAGTYTLTQTIGIATTTGPCFIVTSNSVVIDGAGYSATTTPGNTSYAVVATNAVAGGSAYTGLVIKNITFTNFTNGVNANGTDAVSSGAGGSGGSITISTSTIPGAITANGGTGIGAIGGTGGVITVASTTVTGTVTSNGGNGTSGGVVALPDNAVSNSWFDMTNNKLMLHMNDSSGSIVDTSGNSANGTITGTVSYGATGKIGNALSFSGSAYVLVPDTNLPKGTSARSFSLWFKPSSVSGYQGIFGMGNGNINAIYVLDEGANVCLGRWGGGDNCVTSVTLVAGTWYHLVVTYDGTDAKMYLNGTLGTTAPGRGYNTDSSGNLIIGKDFAPYDQFAGSIDEFAIWSRALSASEVSAIYTGQTTGVVGNGGPAGAITVSASSAVSGTISANGGSGASVGSAALVTIATSTTSSITSSGTGGAISISGTNLNLSNNTYTASTSITLSYSGSLTTTNAAISAITSLVVNGTNYGAYSAGPFPAFPGSISACGPISVSGTYTLTQSITGVTGTCFNITANNVVIDGSSNHYTVTAAGGNTSYAIIATSSSAGGSAYGTTTIQNITFSGFGNGVNASGNDATSTAGGNGGSVIIATSTIPGNINTAGGIGKGAVGGTGGAVSVIGTTVTGTIVSSGGASSGQSALPDNKSSSGFVDMTGNVILYHMNDSSGTLADSSGNGRGGGFTGTPTYNVTGKIGNAVTLSGSNNYITPISNPLAGATAATISMWVKPTSNFVAGSNGQASSYKGLLDSNPCLTGSLRIYGYGGVLNYGVAGNTEASVAIGDWTGQWHNIALTYGSNTSKLYIDGSYIGSVSGTITFNTLLLGAFNPTCSFGSFPGTMDEIGVWSRTLSSTEIANIYTYQSLGIQAAGGSAGAVTISTSTISGAISANGGIGTTTGNAALVTIATSTTSSVTSSGTGGAISISGTDLVLSNNTYTASTTLNISYTNSLVVANTTLSALTALTINGVNHGAFAGGAFPVYAGPISSCGTLAYSGTYTLTQSITGVTGTCFNITANNVVIDGSSNHYTVTAAGGNTSYAIIATSSSAGGSAYGTTTIQNITFSGFGNGVNASGNDATAGSGSVGGSGGAVVVSSSTLGNIQTTGGAGGSKTGSGTAGNGGSTGPVVLTNSITGSILATPGAAGLGSSGATSGSIGTSTIVSIASSTTSNITSTGTNGNIVISGTNLNLSNNSYTASSTLNLAYTGSLTTSGTTLSTLSHLIVNSTDLGSYSGGAFPLIPGTINTCGNIYFAGTYTFGGSVSGNCTLNNSGVTINGAGYILTGNVSAGTYGVNLSRITVTGLVSTTGAGPGAINVSSSSNITGGVSVTGVLSGDGSSSVGSTTIAVGGSVASNSVSFTGNVTNNGTLNTGNSVAGSMFNNGIINGDFVFNSSSINAGTLNGNATLNSSSTNTGTITGTARFNMYTGSAGAVTFSGTTAFGGTGIITGNIYDSTGTQITSWIFNASSTNSGYTKGDATFNNTSKNNSGSTIVGNAVFNNTSTNLGTVTGNADVYSPVVRPLGGTVNGQVIYHGYAGLYFNDSAVGHGTTGKWNDINNWWTDASATVHAPVLPSRGDDVIILFGNISTTTISAIVNTATFQGTTTNGISLTVLSTSTSAAMFNASSTNNSNIIGNATFSGPDTTNNGTVTGYITRQYNAGVYTVVTDFTHNNVHWIVQAINGAQVNLVGATYSLITNAFQALNNGIFTVWNSIINSGSSGTPSITVTSPTAGTIIDWQPHVVWGSNNLCQYKIDGGDYTTVNCANNGSDIQRPTAGSHTLFLKNTDAKSDPAGDIKEQSVAFIYDNTQPIPTDCSRPLDESTRPYYYLTANVAGVCSISTSTTLRGDDGAGHYYTVSGGIIGSSTSNVNLQNITVTGPVSGMNIVNVSSSTLTNLIDVSGTLTGDTNTTFGSTTVESGGSVRGATIVGDLHIKSGGLVVSSSTQLVTVSGSTNNEGTINGDFTLNASSTNSGTINGSVVLNRNSVTSGTINGSATLNNSSYNSGTVTGNLTFGTFTAQSGAMTFTGGILFSGTGIVGGLIKDHTGLNINKWIFNDSTVNNGYTIGDLFFNNSSVNAGTVHGNAYFNDSSTDIGSVSGNADIYYSVATPFTSSVGGTVTYHSYPNTISFSNFAGDNDWSNILNWFTDTTLTTPLGRIPTTGESVVLFSSTTLPVDVTNTVYVGSNNIIIDGQRHFLTGEIFASGAYGGHSGYDFTLNNITVTGTTTANGTSGTNGGHGGNITISTSTPAALISNGGNGTANGGNGGIILVTNSYNNPADAIIEANGGDSTSCGDGGNAGTVTLIDSSFSTPVANPGIGSNSGCPAAPIHTSGSVGTIVVSGHYTAPSSSNGAAAAAAPRANNAGSSMTAEALAKLYALGILQGVSIPVNVPTKLTLKPLPSFGEGKGSFSLQGPISAFLFEPLPDPIAKAFKMSPKLQSFMASVGLSTAQSLATLKNNPFALNSTTTVPGIFHITSGTSTVPTSIIVDSTNTITERINVVAGKTIGINFEPLDTKIKNQKVTAVFNGSVLNFSSSKGSAESTISITVPSEPGTYYLTSSRAAFPLMINVISPVTSDTATNQVTRVSVWGRFLKWIGIGR